MASVPIDNLPGLASVYFGEEWDDLGDTPAAVVGVFVGNQGVDAARATVLEIEALLNAASELQLRDAWNSTLKSAFRVERTGLSYRQWFELLRDLLLKATPAGS